MRSFIIAALDAVSMISSVAAQASPRQASFDATAVFDRAAQGSND